MRQALEPQSTCIVNNLSKVGIITSKNKYFLNQQNSATRLKNQEADPELCQNSVLRDTVSKLCCILYLL